MIHFIKQQQLDIGHFIQNAKSPSIHDTPTRQEEQPTPIIKNKMAEYYNSVKYEEMISCPIRPAYNGSHENLISFLNHLHIRRQDESWYAITFITINGKQYDLTRHFGRQSD